MTHQYKLLECAYSDELSSVVTQHLAEGWELWGNPQVVEAEYDGDVKDIHYFQVVVRFDPAPDQEFQSRLVTALREPAGYSVQVPETPATVPTSGDFQDLARVMAAVPLLRLVPLPPSGGDLDLGLCESIQPA